MSDERPFNVIGVQQIALGAPDKADLRALWVDRLGLSVTGQFRSERENVDEDICAVGAGLARVEIDLMAPIDADVKPAVHLPPLNHVGLWIDDLRGAVAWLEANGVRMAPGGIRAGAAGHDICFIHPRANEAFPVAGAGVLIELVQAPVDVIAAWRAAKDAR
ncbi:MAG: VOC family protein [Caldimonas sp.]